MHRFSLFHTSVLGSSARYATRWSLLVAALAVPVGAAAVQANGLDSCLASAAETFEQPQHLLRAILMVESGGNCSAIGPTNSNGTRDIGCMQINSAWLPLLQTKFGITEADLMDPCTNVHVGAWILAKNVRTHGLTWRAVGAYNATTESKRIAYSWKVRKHLASR